MEKPILYGGTISPPGRAAELTAAALGLDLIIKQINLLDREHLTEEFLKLNPQHTIPVLNDNGNIIWDSHAIIIYLVTKYGKDDKLYPSDPFTRAKINAALHFDSGVLFARLRFLFEPILYYGSPEMPQDKVEYIYKAYELLENTFKADYLVGNTMTLADLSCIASISSLRGVFPIEKTKYPKMSAWVERLTKLPYYKATNQEGADELVNIFKTKLEDNRNKV